MKSQETAEIVTEEFLRRWYGVSTAPLKAGIDFYSRFFVGEMRWHEWVFRNLAIDGSLDILDLGCGMGDLWLAGGRPREIQGHVTLVDSSSAMIAECSRIFAGAKAFSFLCARAEALLQAQREYDRIVAAHVIYHIAEPKSFVADCVRRLRKDGLLVVTGVGRDHLRQLHNELSIFAAANGLTLRNRKAPFSSSDEMNDLFLHTNAIVEVKHYRASLDVTEPDTLVNYVLSMDFFPDAPPGLDLPESLGIHFERLIGDGPKLTVDIHNQLTTAAIRSR
jgi:ubiquinone/menaquinone biosynthesis C-methylase UbiE